MDELLRDFLDESVENLERLDAELVALEAAPGDLTLLRSIFRTIHTIKGTCGFLELARLETVAHAAENVLARLRDGALPATSDVMSDVLAATDVIKGIVAALAETGVEPAGDDTRVIAALSRWVPPGTPAFGVALLPELPTAPVTPVAPEIAAEVTAAEAATTEVATTEAAATEVASTPTAASGAGAASTDHSLRVNVQTLDRLMNLVGELVLTRNRLLQLAANDEGSPYGGPAAQLNRVTTELQEAVMKTRMQPIGSSWARLPRLLRDVCRETGKQVTLEMHGGETELDRQVLQAIQDPLTHMVRNAADHGIEHADVRLAAGKPAAGTLSLSASHEGGHVVIDVRDDGAGLDLDALRRKAVKSGLLTEAQADALPDAAAMRLIFEAGLSTAQKVSSVSGRGVGMDVVRANVEAIGGSVDVCSERGVGTTLRIRIPLTLAIVPALVVACAGHRFAIPQISVSELVTPGADGGPGLEMLSGIPVLRLRDELLPIVPLADHLQSDATPATPGVVVVCDIEGTRYGLHVDEVSDTQEIVVKPTGRLLKHVRTYAGCTILGDGTVILILDPAGIADAARVQRQTVAAAAAATATTHEATTTLLVFAGGDAIARALPLTSVSRLEEIPAARFERADGRWLLQYRDRLLPIVPATTALDVVARDPRPVIVLGDDEGAVGVAVDEIQDVVDALLEHQVNGSARDGVLGLTVVNGRATEVVDDQWYRAGNSRRAA